MKIYLAGPLFNTAERNFNSELTKLLREKGHEVWLPQEFEQRTMTPKQIFTKDVEGIDWADVVVANMDGPDPDSGTCWECGYAYRKKAIIVFRTDFRVDHKILAQIPIPGHVGSAATPIAKRRSSCFELTFALTTKSSAICLGWRSMTEHPTI